MSRVDRGNHRTIEEEYPRGDELLEERGNLHRGGVGPRGGFKGVEKFICEWRTIGKEKHLILRGNIDKLV